MKDKISFIAYLQTSTNEIEKELKKTSVLRSTSSENGFPEVEMLQNRFTDAWFGGKMLRGTLVKLGYELVKKPQAAIFKPACAFEILHTALLIHDDIIDKSLTRRGKSALHVHKIPHYGISQAICLGDIGISLAGQIIAEAEFPSERKNKAIQYFFEMVTKTITGEMMDITSAHTGNRNDEQIIQIHKLKTANYTIVGPLTMGALLAGASQEYIKMLENFAQPLGIAYQILDDILGIFGDEKKLGKSTTSDIEENKSTLLITHALHHAQEKQQKVLRRYYGEKGITKKKQEEIKQILIQTGALTYSQNVVTNLTSKAKKYIPELSKNEEKRVLLTQLCDFLLERNL
jgi:geranylgeranyl diphosphate synthase type I